MRFRRDSPPMYWVGTLLLGIWVSFLFSVFASGEEIRVEQKGASQSLGDFGFGIPDHSLVDAFLLNYAADTDRDCIDVEAGDLWKYFDERGITEMNTLVIYLDAGHIARDSEMTLKSLDFSIVELGNEFGSELIIDQMSMNRDGEANRVLIPGYSASPLRPDAKVEIPLGFNFMSRFCADSRERLRINLDVDGGNSRPALMIEGRQELWTVPSLIVFGGFILFWGAIFWILKRMTMPKGGGPESANTGTGQSQSRVEKTDAVVI